MEKEFFTSVVVAALVSGAVGIISGSLTALITLRTSERTIQIENVTQERAKWREKIRSKALEVWEAWEKRDQNELLKLRLEFALNLNPFEVEDRAILTSIEELADFTKPNHTAQEFCDRVSLLLKHDWERAKCEARPWMWQFSWLRRLYGEEPPRVSFDDFKTRTSP